MSKTTAPLLSFDGRGQIAKTMVYSRWRGIPYVRRHVIPANPNTTAQQFVRKKFALLREMWKIAPTEVQAAWNAFATGRPFTGFNKFVGENVRVLTNPANMDAFIGSPGAAGGLPPTAVTATTGTNAGEIDVAWTAPAPPSGWTLTEAVAMAFLDQAPDGIFQGTISAITDASTPYEGTFTGLVAGEAYQVAGWLVWEKADGKAAYSVGITDQASAHA
jgi:hypothetical protein